MIILSKKKILFDMGIVTMFVFMYVITGLNVNNTKKNTNLDIETIQTVALPVDNKVIVLDAGHRSSR